MLGALLFFLRNGEKFSETLILSGTGRKPDHRSDQKHGCSGTLLFSGRDPSGIRPGRRYLYDPDDRKTPKGRWEDRNRACRPDRGLKQQGDRGGLH